MNKRIKELRKLALVETVDRAAAITHHLDEEKFAELIIRECAKVIDRGDGAMCSLAETSWCNACRDDILKHFGVE